MRPSTSERLRVFVSGATGVYGAHFAKHLLSLGHQVFSMEHTRKPIDSASLLGIKDKVHWTSGDIRDTDYLTYYLAATEVQAVAHFAALPLVRTGTLVAAPVFSINAMGTVSLLDAVKQIVHGGKKIHFLMISTDKVYGHAGDVPYTENTPLNGTGIYEASKAAAEAACRAYQAQELVPDLVISRSCNVIGTADLAWRLVSNTTRQFLSNVPAKLYVRGQYVREFAHISDLVAVQFQLLLRADEYAGQSFNIGSGTSKTQEEVITHIRDVHFPEGHIIRVEPPPHSRVELPYQLLDSSKIRRELGWVPKHTFEKAVADVVAWWREHKELAPWSML